MGPQNVEWAGGRLKLSALCLEKYSSCVKSSKSYVILRLNHEHHLLDPRERALVDLRNRDPALGPAEELEHAKFHGGKIAAPANGGLRPLG